MNKMDDFLKKRLENYTPAEDGWNIPSEDIFNKAKVHFPKKKKKKRFLWLLFIPALMLFSGVGYYLGKTSTNEKIQTFPITEIAGENIIDQHLPASKNNSSEIENATVSNTIKKMNDQADQKLSTNVSTKIDQLKVPTIIQTATLKATETKQIITTTETQNQAKIKPVNRLSFFIENEDKVKLENTEITSKNNTGNASTKSVEKRSDLPMAEVSTSAVLIETKYPNLIKNKSTTPLFQSPTIIIPQKQRLPKSEIGLAFGETIFRLFDLNGTIQEADGTYLSFDLNYTNPNLYYTKWFARKWSLTTGIKYTYFDFDLDLSVSQEITQADVDDYISNDLNDVINYGSFFGAKGNSVEPIPGVELAAGDIINVEAKIEQIGYELELPLFVNYHLRKNRFEWRFTAGVAVNVLNIKLDRGFINLYKEGDLIYTPEWESQLGWSLYGSLHAGASVRYHINNRFNFGLSPRIDLTTPLFSSMEVGFYYRL